MSEADLVFSREIFDCVNRLRENPKSFIPILEEEMKYFDGNVLEVPDKIPLELEEGPKAVRSHSV